MLDIWAKCFEIVKKLSVDIDLTVFDRIEKAKNVLCPRNVLTEVFQEKYFKESVLTEMF